MLATLIGIVAAGCVGVAIVDGPSKRRSVFMAAAIILAGVLLAADQWNATQVAELRGSPGLLAAVFVVGAAAIAATASLIRRWPVLLPVLILIALPFRIPLELGGEEANLLVPLYLVMAGGVAATIWGRFTEVQPASWRVSPEPTGLARWLKPLLAASVVLYALAVLYSDDRSTGLQNLCFFLIPFATVFALMDEVEWNMKTLRLILIVIVFEALACAFVGFIEWGTRSLLWNETVVETNNFHVYFRVNSLFWDPNIYGRYLALAITMVAATLLWSRRNREAWILAGVQTAGRGRRARPWSSPPGNFHGTLVLKPFEPPETVALRSFAAALALRDAFVDLTGLPQGFALKWPNDVLCNGGKIAGILLESQGLNTPDPVLCIGIGVNLSAAPDPSQVEPGALPPGSLLQETGLRITPEAFLEALAPAWAANSTRAEGMFQESLAMVTPVISRPAARATASALRRALTMAAAVASMLASKPSKTHSRCSRRRFG